MEELICYWNGDYIKESEVRISINDRAFCRGTGVFDVSRSFKHVPFFWEEHIDRLYRGLRCVHMDPGLTPEEMLSFTNQVFELNKKSLEPGDDFAIAQYVNQGTPDYHFDEPSQPNILIQCIYLSPRYEKFAETYRDGIHLVLANTRQIPPQCIDVKIKHTSRWVNSLADFEAKQVDPNAWAVMLDINGFVAEGPSFNCFLVRNGKILTPPLDNILGGVTRDVVLRLARQLDMEVAEANLYVYDLYNADEIFITGNSICIAPVAKFNERVLAESIPGPVTQKLIAAFNELVGLDIIRNVMDYVQAKA